MSAVALVDCNSFYASCERVFEPALLGRPLVVASGGDGCVVAATPEARALGFTTGAPLFQHKRTIEREGVVVRAANFALYGDLSRRVMAVLARCSPRREIYSIDEAFCDWSGIADLTEHGHQVREQVRRWTGIPVSIGVADTKVLAKLANRLAKQYRGLRGVCVLPPEPKRSVALDQVPIGDLWGCGPALTKALTRRGIRTARELRDADAKPLVDRHGVAVERLIGGLQGRETGDPPRPGGGRQSVTVSRTFQRDVADVTELQHAASRFTTSAMAKVRSQGSVAAEMTLLLVGNRHRADASPDRVQRRRFNVPTNLTAEALAAVRSMLDEATADAEPGGHWKRLGVTMSGLQPATGAAQAVLFDPVDRAKAERLQGAVDQLNQRLGRDLVRPGSVAATTGGAATATDRSPPWTTDWAAIPAIDAGSIASADRTQANQ